MNSSTRNFLSTASGLALVAYTAIAITTAGFASTSAVIGISALIAWALAQMIVLELVHGSSAQLSAVRATVPAVIAFPRGESVALHAA